MKMDCTVVIILFRKTRYVEYRQEGIQMNTCIPGELDHIPWILQFSEVNYTSSIQHYAVTYFTLEVWASGSTLSGFHLTNNFENHEVLC